MSEIRVTFAALEAARGDVTNTATRISGRLDDLKRAVAPLAATWEGAAADGYRTHQRQWDTAAADLTQVLIDVARALADAEDGYRTTEKANAALWSRA